MYTGALVVKDATDWGLGYKVVVGEDTGVEQVVMSWDNCLGVILRYHARLTFGSSLSLVSSISWSTAAMAPVTADPRTFTGVSHESVKDVGGDMVGGGVSKAKWRIRV
jgi:hypothetical protein